MISRVHLRLAALTAGLAISLGGGMPALAQTAPDILAPLGREILAVFGLDQNPHILIVAEEGESVGYRMLGIGDEYRAGWTITAISAGEVTLQKAARTRTVQIVGQAPPAPSPPAPRARPIAKLSLTNALVGGSPPKALTPAGRGEAGAAEPAPFDY